MLLLPTLATLLAPVARADAADVDGDGYADADEVVKNSDPLDSRSTPTSDDDCDGKPNQDEPDRTSATGTGHPFVAISGGGVAYDVDDVQHPSVWVDSPSFVFGVEEGSSC